MKYNKVLQSLVKQEGECSSIQLSESYAVVPLVKQGHRSINNKKEVIL